MQIVAFSGGKDSTALALHMAELGEEFSMLFTPTGNELPAVRAHVDAISARLNRHVIVPPGPTLASLIETFNGLPSWRMRWCTRMIKILPCIAYLKEHPGTTLCVGLRADEEERQGLYGDFATYRYPLREWGWGLKEVRDYVRCVGVPKRTDCAVCYGQRLSEWWMLWRDWPEWWKQGERWEETTGHTFRSPGRDTWPAGLRDLAAEFSKGRVPRGTDRLLQQEEPCRVCRL